jgi:hypothetical protein
VLVATIRGLAASHRCGGSALTSANVIFLALGPQAPIGYPCYRNCCLTSTSGSLRGFIGKQR